MTLSLTRRNLLKLVGQGSAAAGVVSLSGCSGAMQADSAFAWSDEATAIRARIVPPLLRIIR
ncbi:MAG: hypothetical protein GYB58_01485 [Gammaproteobacteria bacterium]|nr:hypothetical protein [Gammaproteobacteria bacterium]